MANKLLLVLAAACLFSCQNPEKVEDALLENPNDGVFGEAGAGVTKTYDYTFEETKVDPSWFAYTSNKCLGESISAEFGVAFGGIFTHLGANQITPIGMPIAKISPMDETDSVCYDAGVLVADSIGVPEGYLIEPMYAGKVLKLYHYGPYENLVSAYEELAEYMADNDIEVNGEPWDEYKSDPEQVAVDSVLTIVYQPIK